MAMVRSEGNMSLKNSVTPPGIDPAAQRLNHYATPGPEPNIYVYKTISKTRAGEFRHMLQGIELR